MVSAFVSGLNCPGSSPGRRLFCVGFLGKTLYFHSAFLHPGVQMCTGEFNARDNLVRDLTPYRGRNIPSLFRYPDRREAPA